VGAAAEVGLEILLGMTDSTDKNQPDIWIADSAATVHMAPHKEGLINLRSMKQGSYITMGNGKVEEFKLMGDLVGSVNLDNSDTRNRVKLWMCPIFPTASLNCSV
jgi:hypothetical protein